MKNDHNKGVTITQKSITFDYPSLNGFTWPVIDIVSPAPGPHLCIAAGMHPNEVSSMEAAIRLPSMLEELERGSVSILPVVNIPGLYEHSEFICPVDGKNINFCFPGDPNGTFSQALAYALLTDWARNADAVIDLHGGDMREMVAYFTMVQFTGDPEHDFRLRELARCFDADIHVGFNVGQTENAGRATNQSRPDGPFLIMAEGGGNGNLSHEAVEYHLSGCLGVAAEFGITPHKVTPRNRQGDHVSGFIRFEAPHDGRFYPTLKAGEFVTAGQMIGAMRDIWGQEMPPLVSPATGYIVFQVTHNIVSRGDWIFAISDTGAST